MNHFHLKVRNGLKTQNLLLVDSPGMIDSPAALKNPFESLPLTAAERSSSERGYDFLRVTRWLAEHSDVILLFFDPDKPGTTGETLECLTTSLAGMEHKMHIVMNKVDQFVHIHDFARAYGSLCWNLSKVIPRKDLPRIYTMYLPAEARGREGAAALARGAAEPPQDAAASPSLTLSRSFSTSRDEVLRGALGAGAASGQPDHARARCDRAASHARCRRRGGEATVRISAHALPGGGLVAVRSLADGRLRVLRPL